MSNLKVLLVSKPNLKISEVDNSTFKNHQKFSGTKNSLTASRNLFNSYIGLNEKGLKTLSKELNISEYLITRYIAKKPISLVKSKEIVNSLETSNLSEIRGYVFSKKQKRKVVLKDKVTVKDTFDGENKKNVRDLFISHITLTKGKFFTLPSHACTFEKQLNATKDNKFHYVACECEPNIFERLQATVSNSKLFMSTIFGYAGEVLNKANENEFSNMFVDYCGTYPTFDKEVRNVFSNNIVKINGLVGLTFTTREANTIEETSKAFNKKVNEVLNSDETETVKNGIKIKLLAYAGNDYELIEFIDYHDKTPMVFALLRRLK